jgi:NTE family protein
VNDPSLPKGFAMPKSTYCSPDWSNNAVILTGGGARAAYQIGVLTALRDVFRKAGVPSYHNPFPIVCGTSAGAINAAGLACCADNFAEGVTRLHQVWSSLHVSQIYRADSLGLFKTGARWLGALSLGWLMRHPPQSLLDNQPLRQLLTDLFDRERLQHAFAQQHLQALAVSAISYSTGQHVTFFETPREVVPWQRSQRIAHKDAITVDHLLSSSAIPFIFPAQALMLGEQKAYFGDGSMRQLAPISPAIHLGAKKILVIGSGQLHSDPMLMLDPHSEARYPSLAQIAGQAMASIFLDSLAVDIERLERINQTLSTLNTLPDEVRALVHDKIHLRPIDVLVIAPSQRLDLIAARHVRSLPSTMRGLLKAFGGMDKGGAALASYLLFEASFTQELIALGYADTVAQQGEVQRFFGLAAIQ